MKNLIAFLCFLLTLPSCVTPQIRSSRSGLRHIEFNNYDVLRVTEEWWDEYNVFLQDHPVPTEIWPTNLYLLGSIKIHGGVHPSNFGETRWYLAYEGQPTDYASCEILIAPGLTQDEMEFVIWHELGHAVFDYKHQDETVGIMNTAYSNTLKNCCPKHLLRLRYFSGGF